MKSFHLRSGRSLAGLKIGLLGGSFNPAHAGHRAVSQFALKRLGPRSDLGGLSVPQNPLKVDYGASIGARLSKALEIAHDPKIKVTTIEHDLSTTYTIDTLMALKRRFPSTQFVWLMGADNLRQMPKWRGMGDVLSRPYRLLFFAVPALCWWGARWARSPNRFDGAWISVHRAPRARRYGSRRLVVCVG